MMWRLRRRSVLMVSRRLGPLEWVFDIGAGVRQTLEQPEARKPFFEPPCVIGEVLLIGVPARDQIARLPVADDNPVAIVKAREEVLELYTAVDTADDQRLQQAVGRRIANAAA